MQKHPGFRALLVLLVAAAGCRSTPDRMGFSADPELNAFAERVTSALEAHEWPEIIDAAEPAHYGTQVVDHGMGEAQYVAELFGLHRAGNDIKRGDTLEWDDLERIETVLLDGLSTTGYRAILTGTATLEDGSGLRIRAWIIRTDSGYALTGGVG